MYFLDKDGDGKVTLEEIEGAQRELKHRIGAAVTPIKRIIDNNRPVVDIVLGWSALLYSGHFSHLFLCCASIGNSEWANLREKVDDLCSMGVEVKEHFSENMGDEPVFNCKDDGMIRVPEKTLLALLGSIEPARVTKVFQSLYSGLLVALCTSVDQNAAKLGLGVQLGDRISTFLWSIANKMMCKVKVEDEPGNESNQALSWGKLGLRTICTTISLWLSWRLKDMCAAWAACHWGGVKIAQATLRLLNHDDDALKEMLGIILASYGFAYQLRHLNRPPVPWLISFLLTPVYLLEAGLRSMSLSGGS